MNTILKLAEEKIAGKANMFSRAYGAVTNPFRKLTSGRKLVTGRVIPPTAYTTEAGLAATKGVERARMQAAKILGEKMTPGRVLRAQEQKRRAAQLSAQAQMLGQKEVKSFLQAGMKPGVAKTRGWRGSFKSLSPREKAMVLGLPAGVGVGGAAGLGYMSESRNASYEGYGPTKVAATINEALEVSKEAMELL